MCSLMWERGCDGLIGRARNLSSAKDVRGGPWGLAFAARRSRAESGLRLAMHGVSEDVERRGMQRHRRNEVYISNWSLPIAQCRVSVIMKDCAIHHRYASQSGNPKGKLRSVVDYSKKVAFLVNLTNSRQFWYQLFQSTSHQPGLHTQPSSKPCKGLGRAHK